MTWHYLQKKKNCHRDEVIQTDMSGIVSNGNTNDDYLRFTTTKVDMFYTKIIYTYYHIC